jgi:hypothetical protein
MIGLRRGAALHQLRFIEMKKKPLAILSILIIAALTMGMTLAERMEQRSHEDRLSFGDATAQ